MKVSLSIVTYNTLIADLDKVLNSIKQTSQEWTLYIIDNSPNKELEKFFQDDKRIIYHFNNSNIGFGAGHNMAIELSLQAGFDFHFVVNPDIYFNEDIITPMINYINKNKDVGMMMPEVLFASGEIQYLPKLLPSPFSILRRKLKWPKASFEKFICKYELRNVSRNEIIEVPILSGCFSLLNLKIIEEIGGYDEKFFMYFEDFDLSRRVHEKYKTLYFPKVSVYHGYESGANKNLKLFKIFFSSAITYFNKWGWFFDHERDKINTTITKALSLKSSTC
ncbi:glycosyltransferase family 2 protein [Salinimicrobium gaetbulicola]|uniref:Glycosyltransferase family 2 protein n=1 Tax=Salinimicrobium gaetbulicola TaxID=999702 RepID=A0ABW3IE68_9FLAO